MSETHATCWTLVLGAAAGRHAERDEFARRYESLVRAFLRARWGGSRLAGLIDDTVQDIFLELFRAGGALSRFDAQKVSSFRSFLYAVIRNVTRRVEAGERRRERSLPAGSGLDLLEGDEASISVVFDRLWARSVIHQATRRYREASRGDPEAERRVELLELRFGDNLPIREIAERWGVDAAHVHKWYARAREEFRRVLLEELSFHLAAETPVERELSLIASLLQQ